MAIRNQPSRTAKDYTAALGSSKTLNKEWSSASETSTDTEMQPMEEPASKTRSDPKAKFQRAIEAYAKATSKELVDELYQQIYDLSARNVNLGARIKELEKEAETGKDAVVKMALLEAQRINLLELAQVLSGKKQKLGKRLADVEKELKREKDKADATAKALLQVKAALAHV